ncbi:hypothetical protein Pmani_025612 [Petrolisthes manimaculis]|uniref:Uncharacterized protein n=1 Tax=Petrolisthes manimaculis TaxID=1843537 RepID=A0AAE1P7W0_9EUCA|nr:hypothetical protein Pmani_025612 [Petrolisthes manimaculis]
MWKCNKRQDTARTSPLMSKSMAGSRQLCCGEGPALGCTRSLPHPSSPLAPPPPQHGSSKGALEGSGRVSSWMQEGRTRWPASPHPHRCIHASTTFTMPAASSPA